MAVSIDPVFQCIYCTVCKSSVELRGNNPESQTIQLRSYAAKHRCRPETPKRGQETDEPTLTDRWKELFHRHNLDI